VIATGNAARLAATLVHDSDAAGIIIGVAIVDSDTRESRGIGIGDLERRLIQDSRRTVLRQVSTSPGRRLAPAVIPVDDTVSCDSGSVHTLGTLADNGTGTLSVDYNACRVGTQTLSGPATLRVDAFDLINFIPTDLTVSFTRLTLTASGAVFAVGGSLRALLSIATAQETITANIVTLDNNTGEMTKTENLVFVDVYLNVLLPTSFTETINGRVFHSVHGFVDITTTAQLVFPNYNQLFPDRGQMVLTGAGNRSILVTVPFFGLVRLALDLDGDGIHESNATLKWTDLSGPIGADLADSDGDGMHNGWETVNGLNPNSAVDAALDKDGDGVSNLGEYLAGTDPSNASSVPQIANLSITAIDSPDPVGVGGSLTYTITVFNASPSPVADVMVTDTLPAGVTLTSVIASQGSCAGTSSLTCWVGTLPTFGGAAVTVIVTPTATGVIHNTATVTSSSFDPSTTNNSATTTTAVGQLIAGLQAQIDIATDGTTITVGPGVYLGGFNLNGKNITLQSSAGPASTIIHGNNGTAVMIGPGGAIKGFTITGGGIHAVFQGTLISGNIFDGIVGSAIDGNNASSTVERNIFRNNSCDDQFGSGVVRFGNSSSPLIVNNVFENNPCSALNLTLPEGNAPQVINNTLVGNRTGIRIESFIPQVTQVYRNNIVVMNGTGFHVDNPINGPVWENNLVFGNTTDYMGTAPRTGTNGNISADPWFVNGAGGNYRLQPGSPAIDAGKAVGAPGVDFDGTPRPLDGNGDSAAVVDIGAFEAPQIP